VADALEAAPPLLWRRNVGRILDALLTEADAARLVD
jgi:hypothetical protein